MNQATYRLAVIMILFCTITASIESILHVPTVIGTTIASEYIYDVDEKPFGTSFSEWTAKWWQWALSIPEESSPFFDTTGEKCASSQLNSSVWFLVGSFTGPVSRSCDIPTQTASLLPIFNTECDFHHEQDAKTHDDLRLCVRSIQDNVKDVSATINGVNIPVEHTRVESPFFNVTFPDNNIYGVPPADTVGVSDGYWLFLKPLPPGNYVVNVKGLLVDYTTTGFDNIVSDVTYSLKVQ
jgi:hypothetical protein